MFDILWPVGSVYISVTATNSPFQNIGGIASTWQQLATGKTLWNVATNEALGASISGILPDHTHVYTAPDNEVVEDLWTTRSSSAYTDTKGDTTGTTNLKTGVIDCAVGNTLRPPSVTVTMWKRIS